MKKVKMKTLAQGEGIRLLPGGSYELENKFADELINGGYADEIVLATKEVKKESPKIESAAIEQPEKMMISKPEKIGNKK